MFGLKPKLSPRAASAERLLAWAVLRARSPVLYADLGAPDTVEGRFEVLTLHVLLLMDRLKAGDAAALDLRQNVFDVFVSHLDGAMREMGVGDLAMGKRMRKLGEAFYGRAKAYDAAFGALPDRTEFERLIARTVSGGTATVAASGLADYTLQTRERLARCDLGALMAGRADDETETRR